MKDNFITEILVETLPRLWQFALRLTGDTSAAEDLVQNACKTALTSAAGLWPCAVPFHYMLATIYSKWISNGSVFRRQERFQNVIDAHKIGIVNDADRWLKKISLDQIVSAVNELPNTQRVVLLLIEVEGLTYHQAAEIIGVPEDTLRCRLSLSRQSLGTIMRGS